MAIRVENRPVYICSDDFESYDESKANEHEAIIDHEDGIEAFLMKQAAKYKPKTLNLIRAMLQAYEADKVNPDSDADVDAEDPAEPSEQDFAANELAIEGSEEAYDFDKIGM